MEEKRKEELCNVLRKSRLCRGLEKEEIRKLLEQEGMVRPFHKGERIIREMDRPTAVYMLLEGCVIIEKDTYDTAGNSGNPVWRGLCVYEERPL